MWHKCQRESQSQCNETFIFLIFLTINRLFNAAKALDQAVLVCKEIGDLQDVASLAERAANMFQSHGSADTAAASLDKAAKILEGQYPEQALKLFQHAAEIAMVIN